MAIESAVQLENKIARAKGFRTTITQYSLTFTSKDNFSFLCETVF